MSIYHQLGGFESQKLCWAKSSMISILINLPNSFQNFTCWPFFPIFTGIPDIFLVFVICLIGIFIFYRKYQVLFLINLFLIVFKMLCCWSISREILSSKVSESMRPFKKFRCYGKSSSNSFEMKTRLTYNFRLALLVCNNSHIDHEEPLVVETPLVLWICPGMIPA